MKIVIISNRLPITVTQNPEGGYSISRSGGGLATGLDSLEIEAEKHWVGWCGHEMDDPQEKELVVRELAAQNLHPVFLDKDQIEKFYEGYSNSTLWPLCHYFFSYIEYDFDYWAMYQEVNRLFCEQAAQVIEPDDLVWVHDYQLMLLPGMLREKFPAAGIGYFHHIPFPSYEMFRCLPERGQILQGLLGADLIGFHTHDYMRHFITAAYRVLRLDCHVDQVHMNDRVAEVDAYPMGINYALYHDTPARPDVCATIETLRNETGGRGKIILAVDRLDYSKGILLRLKAYADFLENHPEWHGKVTLVMIVVPSRDTVPMYAELKKEIDKQTGALNGKYASIGWIPIHYYYRSFPLEELTAMYHLADVALVTPLRDGMNLVAKEYVAAKGDAPGVLILSEMAGAADELRSALIVNPTDSKHTEAALLSALTMPEEEQLERLRQMQAHVASHDVNKWAQEFMDELLRVQQHNSLSRKKLMTAEGTQALQQRYQEAKNRLLILDYDGTLAGFVNDPAQAAPTPEVLALLEALSNDPHTEVVISSGRDKDTLERWFGHLPLGLAAEHGAFYKEQGIWHGKTDSGEWLPKVLPIVQQVTEKTPGSRIEIKHTALVWHYREVDPWLADLRGTQLVVALMAPCARYNLQVMKGKRIVEIKDAAFTKGNEVERLLQKKPYDFVLAMGDDTTDEDMFAVLGDRGVSIKVGKFSEHARHCLPQQDMVLEFLRHLTGMLDLSRP